MRNTILPYLGITEREDRIRRFLETSFVGIVVWNAQGEVVKANDAFLRMVGYEQEELVRGRVGWRELTPAEWHKSTERALADVGLHRGIEPAENEYVRKDGSRISVMVGRAALQGIGRGGVTLVVDLTQCNEAENRLRESYEMLRELTSHREASREEERKHIARELHDELGQYLTAIRLRTSMLRMQLENDRPELIEQTRALISLVDETMKVVRGVIASLRPAALDTGIAAALEWLTAEFNRNGRTVCHVHLQDENIVVSEGIAVVLFRIAQEALTNVARHAEAENVILRLERMPDAYQLEICDDGIGFDRLQISNRSFGLAGMEERVQMLGGQIEIASSPGIGTAIKVKFPVD